MDFPSYRIGTENSHRLSVTKHKIKKKKKKQKIFYFYYKKKIKKKIKK